jgi:hypothetical protein
MLHWRLTVLELSRPVLIAIPLARSALTTIR